MLILLRSAWFCANLRIRDIIWSWLGFRLGKNFERMKTGIARTLILSFDPQVARYSSGLPEVPAQFFPWKLPVLLEPVSREKYLWTPFSSYLLIIGTTCSSISFWIADTISQHLCDCDLSSLCMLRIFRFSHSSMIPNLEAREISSS